MRSSVHALRARLPRRESRAICWLPSLGGAPDIGLAFNSLAPPTERLVAGHVPAANKIYLFPFREREQFLSDGRLHRRERRGDIFKAFALGVDAEEPSHETPENHHPGS
jgi:hypothetical protein